MIGSSETNHVGRAPPEQTPRPFLLAAGSVVTLVLSGKSSAFLWASERAEDSRPPNIVFILINDLGRR
jgi:hypothetical protein